MIQPIEILPILLAGILDTLLGDPAWIPHPIVYFGKAIAKLEKLLNKGKRRLLKGALMTLFLSLGTFVFFYLLMYASHLIHPYLEAGLICLFLFYGVANKTLIKEGKEVFKILDSEGLDAGRKQLSRIVGRDTSPLNEQQIRTAVLETMSENLSDGVVAPLFYFAIAGIPGIMTYKMINTHDSMIGYKNDRFLHFGRFAAKLDDVVNYIPARITALLIALCNFSIRSLIFIFKFGKKHASPNAGFPEAALAGVLNCRFGGPNTYHGKLLNKPFIGNNHKILNYQDFKTTARTNNAVFALSLATIIGINTFLS